MNLKLSINSFKALFVKTRCLVIQNSYNLEVKVLGVKENLNENIGMA